LDLPQGLKEARPAVPRAAHQAVALVGRTQRSDVLLTQPEAGQDEKHKGMSENNVPHLPNGFADHYPY